MIAIERTKLLNIALWIVQALLAALFMMTGFMKLGTPLNDLAVSLPWVKEVPETLVRSIGLVDLLGGAGLLLPSALRIKPVLTPIAALGIILEMILAILFHLSRGETAVIGFNFILIFLAAFVAWGRLKKEPILSR